MELNALSHPSSPPWLTGPGLANAVRMLHFPERRLSLLANACAAATDRQMKGWLPVGPSIEDAA